MKKLILLIALALYMCWKSLEPIPQNPVEPPPPTIQSPTAEKPTASAALPPAPVDAETLREELAQLDHEIARTGYPEVMMDERLSEEEREELISKVLRSTKLYDRILQLKIAGYRKGRL